MLADVAVVLLFSAVLAISRGIVPQAAGAAEVSATLVLWEIGGAMLDGAVLGGAVTVYLRFIGHELAFFALLVALLGAEVARVLHVETLLTLLTAGFVAENASRGGRRGTAPRHERSRLRIRRLLCARRARST